MILVLYVIMNMYAMYALYDMFICLMWDHDDVCVLCDLRGICDVGVMSV